MADKVTEFSLIYMVDGLEQYVEKVEKGTRLGVGPKPTKEFHKFSGWSKIPSRMPARDVVVEGFFTPCEYDLTFVAEGREVSRTTLAYGTPITPAEPPALEGRTFRSWQGLPETMPGGDLVVEGLYTPNEYTITYTITDDTGHFGTTSFVYPCTYGEVPPVLDAPSRPYHTFSGWDNVPETMPAENVTVHGSISLTLFKLTRIVDGEVFKEEYLPFGAAISKKPNPEKEGHYFSGFRALPKTMPDHDVEVVSSMYPARYKADFIMNEALLASKYIPYGSEISFEPQIEPGYTFAGWEDCPDTMPAHDIEVHGKMVRNKYRLSYIGRGKELAYDYYELDEQVAAHDAIDIPGFTFMGWKDIPETMPDHDVAVLGDYRIAATKVSFVIDGEEYSSVTLGAEDTDFVEPVPTAREGYTFAGWNQSSFDQDGTLTLGGEYVPNCYSVHYMVDGEEVITQEVAFGSKIYLPDGPAMANRTFVGWSEIPETMPDHDLYIESTYTDNVYRIEFVVSGEIIAEYVRTEGSEIEIPEAPAREGHTFGGWIDPPATMPDYDVTVNGVYNVNSYTVTYMVDDKVFAVETVEYGDTVPSPTPAADIMEKFGGWEKLPATMPAQDITVNALAGDTYYSVFFEVDGNVFASAEYIEGVAVALPEGTPEKLGFTFTGWQDVPAAMPAAELHIAAGFEPTLFTVTFTVRDEAVGTFAGKYGDEVVIPEGIAPEDPAFCGWLDLPATVPAGDVTVAANMDRAAAHLSYVLDGETVAEYDIYPGEPTLRPEIPQREGHVFAGWRNYASEMPAADHVVEGFYIPDSFVATFMADGTIFAQTSVKYGAPLAAPSTPSVPGMRFVSWDALPETMPMQDITVNAVLEADADAAEDTRDDVTYYVYRFTAFGATVSEQKVAEGTACTPPEAPVKLGYLFSDWGKLPEEADSDLELVAHYVPTSHSLILVDDGICIRELTVNCGDPVILPEDVLDADIAWNGVPAVMPCHDVVCTAEHLSGRVQITWLINGETFLTEYKKPGEALTAPALPERPYCDAVPFDGVPELVGEEPMSFEAKLIPHAHKAYFMCCGEEIAVVKCNAGEPIPAPEFIREIDGIIYRKWASLPETMPDEDITVNAQGETIGGIVTFVVDGQTISTQKLAEGMEIKIPEVAPRQFYTFSGFGDVPATMERESLTFEGTYVPDEFTITYKVKGQIFKVVKCRYTETIEPLEAPTVKKRVFVKWGGLPQTMPAEDVKTEALYVTQNTFMLSFRIDGEPFAESVLEAGTRIIMPTAPKKDGFTFTGWDRTVDKVGRENVIINGHYEPFAHDVVFMVNGAEYARYTVNVGDRIALPEDPDVGLSFHGWTDVPHIMPNRDVVSEALLGGIYTIVFMAEGAKVSELILNENDPITAPDAPVKEGYTFDGWDGLAEIAKEDLICTAKFLPIIRRVTFMLGDDVYATTDVAYGHEIDLPAEPDVGEQIFEGWQGLPALMGDEDITVYASVREPEYVPVEYTLTYRVGGEDYATYTVTEGTALPAPDAPTLEVPFLGWQDLPEVMPSCDTVIDALLGKVFDIHFVADGAEIACLRVNDGEAIPAVEAPAKTGYEFAAWLGLPETATEDATCVAEYAPLTYHITFVCGDAVVYESDLAFGQLIQAPVEIEDAPLFAGWEDLPEFMGAEDLTVRAIMSPEPAPVVEAEPVVEVVKVIDEDLAEESDTVVVPVVIPVVEDEPEEVIVTEEPVDYVVAAESADEESADDIVTEEPVEETVEAIAEPAMTSVTFVLDGVEMLATEMAVGAAIVCPEVEIPEDRIFDGWGELPEAVGTEPIVISAETRSAAPALYTITFMVGDEIYCTAELTEGSEIAIPEEPNVDGMIFDGWDAIPETMPAEAVTVSAKLSQKLNTVRFMIGEDILSEIRLAPGTKITPPDAPERAGYSFAGWGDIPLHMGDETLVINGTYIPNVHTVRFLVNKKIVSQIQVLFGETIPLPEEEPTKKDSTFFGWKDIPETMPDEDLKLQAVFKCVFPVTYIIDEEVFHEDLLAPKAKIVPPEVPEKYGYTFSGWSEYPAKVKHEPITVTGTYVPNVHVATFMDGDVVYAQLQVPYGEVIPAVEDPNKPTATFVCWQGIPDVMPNEDITIEAEFEVPSYPVAFVLDGSRVSEAMIEYGKPITCPNVQSRIGYTFGGWENLPDYMPAGALIISGSYVINEHKVRYMVDNLVYAEQNVKYGDAITAPEGAPEKKKHVFVEWLDIPETMPDEDIYIQSSFITNREAAKLMRKVTFRVDGKKYDTVSTLIGKPINLPIEPFKNGYDFVEWKDLPEAMPDKNIKIDALFAIKRCKVTFEIDGEVYYETTLAVGSPVPRPIPRVKEGMVFSDWKNYTSVMPSYDFTVYGSYRKSEYTVTYMVHGEEFRKDSYAWGDSIMSIIAPDTKDTTFVCWQYLPDTMPKHDIVVNALYRKREFKVTYLVDGVTISYNTVGVGNTITPPSIPERKNGKVVIDWINMPADGIMPNHDLVMEAVFGSKQAKKMNDRRKKPQADKYDAYDDSYAYDDSKPVAEKPAETSPKKSKKKSNQDGKEYVRQKMHKLMR